MKRQEIRKTIIFVSFLLFPITLYYFSPFLPIAGAYEGVVAGSLALFTLLFLASLFLGRAFCGWLCPGSGLQECCSIISNKATKGGKLNWIKYFIWTPWIITILAGIKSANGFHKIDLLYHTNHGISVAAPFAYTVYFIVIALIVVPALTAGKRSFCHYICWMAPFMVIGDWIRYFLKGPSLHLIADKDTCIKCNICNRKCQMSLDVMANVIKGNMRDSECILCGECVDACPKKTIAYRFSRT